MEIDGDRLGQIKNTGRQLNRKLIQSIDRSITWMDGQIGQWIDGHRLDGWMDRSVDQIEWIDRDGSIDREIHRLDFIGVDQVQIRLDSDFDMNGRMDGWMDGKMGRQIYRQPNK